ncbi:MAG: hypothetical protein AMXMBFR82_27710 [Candidatus Hydrogenedentota bacterium]
METKKIAIGRIPLHPPRGKRAPPPDDWSVDRLAVAGAQPPRQTKGMLRQLFEQKALVTEGRPSYTVRDTGTQRARISCAYAKMSARPRPGWTGYVD